MEFLKFNDFVNENKLNEAAYDYKIHNAITMKDVKKVYPKAKKTSEVHGAVFYIELEKDLFAKAVSQNTMKSVEPFVIEAVYQMKGKRQKFLYTESVNESNKYSVHYSDGMRSAQEFKREDQAMQFAKDLIKTKKGLQFVSVHKPGMHQTAHKEDLLAWWGPGSYWDNVSKKDKDIVKMQISESVNEAADYSELALSDIASIVYDDWKKISPHAAPYLDAMLDLENITDRYFMDSGISIVAYFLSNARTWKGSVAKDVKKELNKRLKNAR